MTEQDDIQAGRTIHPFFIPLFGTPREAVTHYQALVDAGVQYFGVAVQGNDRETARLLAEQMMPELKPRVGSGQTTAVG